MAKSKNWKDRQNAMESSSTTEEEGDVDSEAAKNPLLKLMKKKTPPFVRKQLETADALSLMGVSKEIKGGF